MVVLISKARIPNRRHGMGCFCCFSARRKARALRRQRSVLVFHTAIAFLVSLYKGDDGVLVLIPIGRIKADHIRRRGRDRRWRYSLDRMRLPCWSALVMPLWLIVVVRWVHRLNLLLSTSSRSGLACTSQKLSLPPQVIPHTLRTLCGNHQVK